MSWFNSKTSQHKKFLSDQPFLFFRISIILYGFTTTISQIVLMRELLAVFYGNELSMGIMLAVWLWWTAVGSGLVGQWLTRFRWPFQIFGLIFVIQSVLLPLTIYANRVSLAVIDFTPGEITGLAPIILIPLVTLSLYCLLTGALFTLACQNYASFKSKENSAAGKIYYLESVGAGLGGLAVSILLIKIFTAFQITTLVGTLNLLTGLGLIFSGKHNRIKFGLFALGIGLFGGLILNQMNIHLEQTASKKFWKESNVVKNQNSYYGVLTVTESENTWSFFENGLLAYTVPDQLYAEEAVHLALLQHPQPRSVLLIGGGMNGSLAEILKHPSVERVDYVELDPTMIELSREILPEENTRALIDSRVELHLTDGRRFLKTTRQKFDVIITNLPDPSSTLINRFYTVEFFREINAALSPTGVFAFDVTSSENYISLQLARYLGCLFQSLRQVFPQIVMIPGNTNHFFAAQAPAILTEDAEVLIARLKPRQIQTGFVNEFYLPFQMSTERMQQIKTTVKNVKPVLINYDFKPVAYYFDLVLWSRATQLRLSPVFEKLFQYKYLTVLLILILLLPGVFFSLIRFRHRRSQSEGIINAVLLVGFTGIGLEIGLILAFQALYGYAYHQAAILVTAFMCGLAAGSWFSNRQIIKQSQLSRKFLRLQLFITLLPLFLSLILTGLAKLSSHIFLNWLIEVTFLLLVILAGLAGGLQFPLANKLAAQSGEKTAGRIYAFDLAGSCLGALLTSSILLPLIGIHQTFFLYMLLNALVLGNLILIFRRGSKISVSTQSTPLHE